MELTFQILEGFEKGRLFRALSSPVSIGREDENSLRLNDDRVSRFHAKISVEKGEVILVDLDSTNGTRVNGQPINLR
jgi:pSer/pThr/pTyr-binding forkhead associated (FHA) protein